MKIRTIITDYFSFNRAEQRGISILLLILVSLLLITRFMPARTEVPLAGVSAFEKEITAFTAGLKQKESEPGKNNRYKVSGYYALPFVKNDSNWKGTKSREPDFFVEINSADTMELQRLRGIGPGFARRIVSYRNKLGGFYGKSQILEVFGMDTGRYNMIRDHLIVNSDSVRKIDINNVTFKSLISHPYFPYEITREIILYRKKAKRFHSMEELKNVKGVNDSVYRKISLYVEVK